jgi:hypothetical protein
MKNLAHSESFDSDDKETRMPGIKHQGGSEPRSEDLRTTSNKRKAESSETLDLNMPNSSHWRNDWPKRVQRKLHHPSRSLMEKACRSAEDAMDQASR